MHWSFHRCTSDKTNKTAMHNDQVGSCCRLVSFNKRCFHFRSEKKNLFLFFVVVDKMRAWLTVSIKWTALTHIDQSNYYRLFYFIHFLLTLIESITCFFFLLHSIECISWIQFSLIFIDWWLLPCSCAFPKMWKTAQNSVFGGN